MVIVSQCNLSVKFNDADQLQIVDCDDMFSLLKVY